MSRIIELGSGGERALAVGERGRGVAETLERYAVVVLLMLTAVGFALRVGGIARVGFAEDEINKLDAVSAYERGDFTQNAEHPMVMKALVFVSVDFSSRIANEAFHSSFQPKISGAGCSVAPLPILYP